MHVMVGYFPCGESFWSVIVVRWIDFAGDDVVQMFPEFNLAFEAPLLVGSLCEVLIVLTIVVNAGLIDIVKIRTEYSSEEKIASPLSIRVGLYPKYW